MNPISWLFLACLLAAGFMMAFLQGCSTAKPYFPDFYEAGDSIDAACGDVIFERTQPRCADIGWCAQYGNYLKVEPQEGELCVGP